MATKGVQADNDAALWHDYYGSVSIYDPFGETPSSNEGCLSTSSIE